MWFLDQCIINYEINLIFIIVRTNYIKHYYYRKNTWTYIKVGEYFRFAGSALVASPSSNLIQICWIVCIKNSVYVWPTYSVVSIILLLLILNIHQLHHLQHLRPPDFHLQVESSANELYFLFNVSCRCHSS